MKTRSRKILRNNYKSMRLSGVKKGRIGTPLPIVDKNNKPLAVGDSIRYGEYRGILLYCIDTDEYVIALDYSMWYGDDPYDFDSYGKAIKIPMDNGARIDLEKYNV